MDKELLNKIKEIKIILAKDGFIICGVFGSYSRNEQNINSDIDILYDLQPKFRDKYKGFSAVAKIDEIKSYLSSLLGIKVDLVQKQTLGNIAAKYILPETIYV